MTPIEMTFIVIIPLWLITLYLLNKNIKNTENKLNSFIKSTEQHIKEIDYAFLAVAHSMELITEAIKKASIDTTSNMVKDKLSKIKSSTERFMRIKEITSKQLELFGAVDAPSASASHSRHKNSIAKQIKELEEEKRGIMQSMLDDGIDPQISTIDSNGQVKTMKMSEAMNLVSSESSTDQINPRKPKKNGNIIKLFGKGDDDDEDDTGNKTIH